jgi:FAD:protein FMN transferase
MPEPVTLKRALMGSPFTFLAHPGHFRGNREDLMRMLEIGCGEVARIEDLLTDFRPSPLNEINEQAGVRPVAVTEEVLSLIRFAQQVSRDSEGAFDITYAAVGQLWRRAFATGVPPSEAEVAEKKKLVDYRRLVVDEDRGTVFLPEPGMRIGLGGVGKGYAVDRVYDLFRRLGLTDFVVNGAGDIRVQTSPDAPRPWRIGVRNPLAAEDHAMGQVLLRHGAVATSGDYERYFKYRGRKYHHILDARSSEIRADVASVTILAPTALAADVYATTAMALGLRDGERFLKRRRGIRGFIVSSTGEVIRCDDPKGAMAA